MSKNVTIENDGIEIKNIEFKSNIHYRYDETFDLFLSYHPQAFRFIVINPTPLIKEYFDKTTFILIEFLEPRYTKHPEDLIQISLKNQDEILYQFKLNINSDKLDFASKQYIEQITQILIYFCIMTANDSNNNNIFLHYDTHLVKFKTLKCSVVDNRNIHIENDGIEIKNIYFKPRYFDGTFDLFLSYHPQAFRLIINPTLFGLTKEYFDKTTFILIEFPAFIYYDSPKSDEDFLKISLKDQDKTLYQFKLAINSDRLDFGPKQYLGPITQILIYFYDTHFDKFKTIQCSVVDNRAGDIFHPIPDSVEKIPIINELYILCITSDLRNTPEEAIQHDKVFLLPKSMVERLIKTSLDFNVSKGKFFILPDISYDELKVLKDFPISTRRRGEYPHIFTLHEYEQDIYKVEDS